MEIEPIFVEALKIVIRENAVSMSMLQRKLCIGFHKAGLIVEWMEENGFVTPYESQKSRLVLITKEEFLARFGVEL